MCGNSVNVLCEMGFETRSFFEYELVLGGRRGSKAFGPDKFALGKGKNGVRAVLSIVGLDPSLVKRGSSLSWPEDFAGVPVKTGFEGIRFQRVSCSKGTAQRWGCGALLCVYLAAIQ